jgi:heat-inducible transcriptional repressor
MMQVAEPSAEERAAIEQRLGNPGPIETALENTSALLSDLTAAAGVVMVPRREPRLSQLTLVPLSRETALAILVGEDGQIENRVLNVPPGTTRSMLEQASNFIAARLVGHTLADAARVLQADIATGRSALDEASGDLITRGLAIWTEDAERRPVLIVRGQANLLDENALSDIERVRQLIDDLENKQSVATLLESAREAEATRIFIGSENRLFALSGSSVVASPYRDREGRVIGVLGVIGPTRLNYARVVPMVDFTAQSLGKLIG